MPPQTSPESLPSQGTVFLTFDDGPNTGTDRIVDTLRTHGVHGTFFMTGKATRNYKGKLLDNPKAILEIAEVGNHSDTHANGTYRKYYKKDNSSHVTVDFQNAEETLDTFGLNHTLARFPGRNTWRVGGIAKDDNTTKDTKEEAGSIAEKKYQIFGWDTEWERGFKINKKPASAELMANAIVRKLSAMNTTKEGKIVVLMHDDMFSSSKSAENLSKLIGLLKEKGLSFGVLSSY